MKKSIFMAFVLAIVFSTGIVRADEITVAEGTEESERFPMDGYNGDCYQREQVIYSADMLSGLQNNKISQMTFYLSSPSDFAFTGTFKVGLAITENSEIPNPWGSTYAFDNTAVTNVYEGTLAIINSKLTIVFKTPFEYTSGNLLFDLWCTEKGNSKDVLFLGIEASYGASAGLYNYSTPLTESSTPNRSYTFVPKTTFTTGEAVSCAAPQSLAVQGEVQENRVSLQWTGGSESQWNLRYKANGDEDWKTVIVNTNPFELSGLTAKTDYVAQVQAVCSEEEESAWSSEVNFTTAKEKCDAPQDLKASVSPENTAEISWTDAEGTAWTIKVEHDGDVTYFNQYLVDGTTVILPYLASDADYSVQVARIEPCESDFTAAVTFHTYCGTYDASELPLKEDFESVSTGTLPACWLSRESNGFPQVVSGSAAFGADEWTDGKCVGFLSNAEEILILPKFDVPVKSLVLKLRYRNTGNALAVGYLEDLGQAFQEVQALEGTNYDDEEPTAIKFNEISFEGNGYVAIYYSSADYYGRAYVDNIELDLDKDTPTSAENVDASKAATKRIEDGQLIIIRDGVKFNAVGTVVK